MLRPIWLFLNWASSDGPSWRKKSPSSIVVKIDLEPLPRVSSNNSSVRVLKRSHSSMMSFEYSPRSSFERASEASMPA